MQDECYAIAADGWKADTYRVIETDKKGKQKDKGWVCDLVPKPLIVACNFVGDQAALEEMIASKESLTGQLNAIEEEHCGEEGVFAEMEKVTLANVCARLSELAREGGALSEDEEAVLSRYLSLCTQVSLLGKQIVEAEKKMDATAYAKYRELSEADVKALLVGDK